MLFLMIWALTNMIMVVFCEMLFLMIEVKIKMLCMGMLFLMIRAPTDLLFSEMLFLGILVLTMVLLIEMRTCTLHLKILLVGPFWERLHIIIIAQFSLLYPL